MITRNAKPETIAARDPTTVDIVGIHQGCGPWDYGGVAEVAEYLGITKQNVINCRARYADFPEPMAALAMGPIYRLCAIREWSRSHKRRKLDV